MSLPSRAEFESCPYEENRWSVLKSLVRDVEAWAKVRMGAPRDMTAQEHARVRQLFHQDHLSYDNLLEMVEIHKRLLPHWSKDA